MAFSFKSVKSPGGLDRLKDSLREARNRSRAGDAMANMGVLSNAGENLAIIAAANEFGTDRIPSRPFLRNTLKSARLKAFRDKQMEAFVKDKFGDPRPYVSRLAAFAVGEIQRTMPGTPPPNAPSTIAKKGSSTTLVDTGRLRQSISWELASAGHEKGGHK